MAIKFRDDMYRGEPLHPQCCFFEAFASSPDPDESFYGFFFCHMSGEASHAEVCRGDYVLCPLAYGKSNITERIINETNLSKAVDFLLDEGIIQIGERDES